jgi:hypothetical protein
MKTTLMFRQMIANPRRTTLAHLKDLEDLDTLAGPPDTAVSDVRELSDPADGAAGEYALPQSTANTRRTVLTELPKTPVAP